MNRVKKAFRILIGYCEKHDSCDKKCCFYDAKKMECVLRNTDPVCDWKMPNEKKTTED